VDFTRNQRPLHNETKFGFVIPAKAGIQWFNLTGFRIESGMTILFEHCIQ